MEALSALGPAIAAIVTGAIGWLVGITAWGRFEKALALYDRMPETVKPEFEQLVKHRARQLRLMGLVPSWSIVCATLGALGLVAWSGFAMWSTRLNYEAYVQRRDVGESERVTLIVNQAAVFDWASGASLAGAIVLLLIAIIAGTFIAVASALGGGRKNQPRAKVVSAVTTSGAAHSEASEETPQDSLDTGPQIVREPEKATVDTVENPMPQP